MMTRALKLNKAAIDNLLGGQLPSYATVKRSGDEFKIVPMKIRRGDVVEIDQNVIPIEGEQPPGSNLAVRRSDDGSLIVYPVDGLRKNFQPSAKIIKFTPTPRDDTPVRSKQKEAVEPEAENVAPEVLPTMLIRASEIAALPPKPQPTAHIEVADLETQARKWVAERPRPITTLNFAPKVVAPIALGEKREEIRTITVPKSFDRRRELGQRVVEVMVKRRRFH